MSIKVGDIVVNLLDASRVGQYIKEYDVRILPEMITDKRYAEVMYIDDDGAIIAKEFGPYAYPADALRLATEEEKHEYEVDKYTIKLTYRGEETVLPIQISKSLIDAEICFDKDNIDISEKISGYISDSWNTLLKGQDKIRAILLMEFYNARKRMNFIDRGNKYMRNIVNMVFESRNNDIKADFMETFYANPIKSSNFYAMIETEGHEIPSNYAELIKKESGYSCACMLKGTDLYDYLRENGRYNSCFPHYNQLKVTKKGLDLLIELDWTRSDVLRLLEKLNMTVEDIRHILMNPNRSFSVDVSIWFKSLSWEDVMANRDIFERSLKSEGAIKDRLINGKYVTPEIAGKLLVRHGHAQTLIQLDGARNKSELKLKEMVAFLEGLSDEITLEHFMLNKATTNEASIRSEARLFRETMQVLLEEPINLSTM